jgi:Xaa-Pro aminopeptidase
MRWRHAAAVITADGREAMLCVDMEETTVRNARPDVELRVWGEFGGSAMETLAALVTDLGLASARIGIELGYVSVADHATLIERLPSVQLVAVDGLLAEARQIKTPVELDLLTRLARISDKAIKGAFEAVHAGCSERDLAAALTRGVYAQGAQQFKLMIVATGERSQLPNVGPSDRLLRNGDVCRVEIFSMIDGYHAGVCRTAVVGDAPPEAERIYRKLAECKRLLLDTMRPGVPARAVWDAFRTKFDELGMPPISFVGHGIGVDLHEPPYLGPFAGDSVLRPGMVLGVEPLVYRTGHGFGMQIKDMVAVDASSVRLLSDVTDTDQMFRIPA